MTKPDEQLLEIGLFAFSRIVELWRLSDAEQEIILGCAASNEGNHTSALLERISLILGIYKALHILLPEAGRAAIWLRSPNSHPSFGGRSALQFIRDERIDGLRTVRRYLDGQLY